MFKRLTVLVLIFAFSFSVASCASQTNIQQPVETPTITTTAAPIGVGTLKLAFCANDSLNPYSAQSKMNKQLSSLMFDPLVKLDNNLNPNLILAEKVEVSGKSCTVTLKSVMFSDGSYVSGDDVVLSYNLAITSPNSIYTSQLNNVSSCNSNGQKIVFTLKTSDPNFSNLLDFPIIKSGTLNRKNADNKVLPPIGSGRYVFNYENGEYSLKPNSKYHDTVSENYVKLVNIPDNEAWQYAVRANDVDIYYSGEDTTNLPSFTGGTTQIKHTDLVYLNVSDNSEILSNNNLKRAIYDVINRKQITESAFYTYAYPAVNLFPDTVKFAETTYNGLSPYGNSQTANEYMSNAGYSAKNEKGIFLDKNNKPLKLKLLYNKSLRGHKSTAITISEQLRKFGIETELDELESASFVNRVGSGNYDLAIFEIKLNKNFNLNALFDFEKTVVETTTTQASSDDQEKTQSTENSNKFNAKTLSKVKSAYLDYLSGKTKITDFMNIYFENIPFIPICYRSGLTGYSQMVSIPAVSSVSDAYYNFQSISAK